MWSSFLGPEYPPEVIDVLGFPYVRLQCLCMTFCSECVGAVMKTSIQGAHPCTRLGYATTQLWMGPVARAGLTWGYGDTGIWGPSQESQGTVLLHPAALPAMGGGIIFPGASTVLTLATSPTEGQRERKWSQIFRRKSHSCCLVFTFHPETQTLKNSFSSVMLNCIQGWDNRGSDL